MTRRQKDTPIRLKRVKAKVLRILDGDTIDVTLYWWRWLWRHSLETRIRFAGMDAPELWPQSGAPEPYAIEAAAFVVKKIEGKTIELEFAIHKITNEWVRESGGDWEKKRLLAIVYTRWGENLNVMLVKKGLARVYQSPTWMTKKFATQLNSAQTHAKRWKRGMWKNQKQNAVRK